MTALADGLREVQRGVWKLGKQAWKRAAGCVPAAIYASYVAICEFTLELRGPALSRGLLPSVCDSSVDCVDIRAMRRSTTTTESLKG
jgi:hypothetical protein